MFVWRVPVSLNQLIAAVTTLFVASLAAANTPATFVNNSVGLRNNLPMAINPQGFVRAESETSLGYNGKTGHVSVGGLSEYGVAKAYATGSREGFYGLSQAGWYDWLKIDGGALNGQTGHISFAIGYDWRLEYNELAPIDLRGQVSVNLGNNLATVWQSPTVECAAGAGCTTYNADRLFTHASGVNASALTVGAATREGAHGVAYFELPFVFGVATPLTVSISASVGSHIGSSDLSVSRGSVFADHSLNWGGVVSVKDASGNAVPYKAASTSAFDYTQPFTSAVPEPGAAGLMGVGLLLLAVRRVRKA